MEQLLSEIEAFRQANEMSKSRFGELAMNDKAFVFDLEKGERRILVETAEKVRQFMISFKREAA